MTHKGLIKKLKQGGKKPAGGKVDYGAMIGKLDEKQSKTLLKKMCAKMDPVDFQGCYEGVMGVADKEDKEVKKPGKEKEMSPEDAKIIQGIKDNMEK